MFEGFANHQAAAETVRGVLEKYLSNERPFAASIDKKSLGSRHDSRGLMVVQYMFMSFSDQQQIKTPAYQKPWRFREDLQQLRQPYDQLLLEIINQGKEDLEKAPSHAGSGGCFTSIDSIE